MIGEGTDIGRRSVISAAKLIEIGEKVLIAPNTLIMDHQHEYRNHLKPIMDQGITRPRTVKIGRGAWLGMNSAIFADVGANSVIGSNSVVLEDIPDFCVAVGQPARIVKVFLDGRWVRVGWFRRLIIRLNLWAARR